MSMAGVPPDILDRAIEWAVRLQSGVADAEVRASCAAWRAADAAHERAWQQIEAVEQAFRNIPPSSAVVAHRALQSAVRQRNVRLDRRRVLKLMGWGAVGVASGLLVATQLLWQHRETHATAVGVRRRIVLADGTQLQLNTASAADVLFTPLRRLIVLRQGEIAMDTGRDADSFTGRRPFWVETAHARLEAIGTRFTVLQTLEETRVHVADGAVAIHVGAARPLLMHAGETFSIKASTLAPARVIDPTFDPAAWADGVIVAKQMRLDTFVAELSRYRDLPVRCDPAVAGLRVSGVFQLDGPDPAGRALDALARTLPVRAVLGVGGTVVTGGVKKKPGSDYGF